MMRKAIKLLWLAAFLFHAPLHAAAQRADSAVVKDVQDAGVVFSDDNSVTLLMSGQEKFDDLFQAIRDAQSSVHLEYFNFRNDSIADLLFETLKHYYVERTELRCARCSTASATCPTTSP